MDTGLPAPFDQIDDGNTKESLRKIVAALAAGYHVQHNPDDTHGTITSTGSVSERSRAIPQGVWIPVTYLAANFTAAGATWTVTGAEVVVFKYMLLGLTMFVSWYLETTTLSAAVATLTLRIPVTVIPNVQGFNACAYDDNGTRGIGTAQARRPASGSNGIFIDLSKDIRGSANWTNSAALTVAGQIQIEFTGTL